MIEKCESHNNTYTDGYEQPLRKPVDLTGTAILKTIIEAATEG
jgi:hypothetical protein